MELLDNGRSRIETLKLFKLNRKVSRLIDVWAMILLLHFNKPTSLRKEMVMQLKNQKHY
jgi:hypothetical protein